jgi:hypothetical protein
MKRRRDSMKLAAYLGVVVASILAASFVAVVHAETPTFRPLTDDTLKAAIAEAQDSKAPMDFAIFRASRQVFRNTEGESVSLDAFLAMMERAPFYVTILTPYQRVLFMASDAKRRFAEPPAPTAAAVNAEGVVFHVSEGGNFPAADVIEDLVLKQGERVIRALKKDVTPTGSSSRRAGVPLPNFLRLCRVIRLDGEGQLLDLEIGSQICEERGLTM